MDVKAYLELKPAPRALFEQAAQLKARPRFMLPTPDGDWRALTWGAWAKMTEHCALFLAASGLKQGERAAIFGSNSVEWMSAALAIQAAGGAMVPIYPASTAEQAAYVAGHSDARALFVDGAQLPKVLERWAEYAAVERVVTLGAQPVEVGPLLDGMRQKGLAVPPMAEVEKKLLSWSRAQALGQSRAAEAPGELERLLSRLGLDQVAQMLYTSGTSGNPKGVPLTHRNVGLNGRDWLQCLAPLLEENDVDLLWLPMSHIFGFGEACLGNTLGWTTYLSEPAKVLQHLPEVRPTVFMSVPQVWEKLAQGPSIAAATGGRLRFCLSGGAGLKREVKEKFHAQGMLIIEGYGLTECSPTLTMNKPGAFRFDTVGKVFPSVEVRLAEDGEILARGPTVFGGYHKDPAATKDAFTADGWFKTGDVGRFTDDGFLQIVDRKKDILVTAGGKNVPPANIELRFRDDPFIAQVVVYGDARKFLVAGVWLNQAAVEAHLTQAGVAPGARAEAARALVQTRVDQVNAQLASYETIKKFAIIDAPLTVEGGLLTSTLKIRRKQIYAAHQGTFEELYA